MAIIQWNPWNLSPRWGFRFPSYWSEDEDWFDASEGLSMYETDSQVVVKAAIPGVPADKVDITVENGMLTIKAEMEETEEEKNKKKVVYKGSRRAKFFYQTSLPNSVKADKAEAEVTNGMVQITLPKAEEAKPKKISITTKTKK